MNSLRTLLLDCRSALRRADPAFESSPLRKRLDDALIELGKPADAKSAAPELPVPETHAAQQVAYAWQVAAATCASRIRNCMRSSVSACASCSTSRSLDDPAIEIQRLQGATALAQAAAEAARRELDELRQALADAVPGIDDKIPPRKQRACACAS